ncbi:AAA family ATPase [Pseudomonas aeruginosa]|uniref:AAA family ATPase n=1 Tax=Pseudomonas aeruginosa TaxID=287 RepID=UPI00193C5202|nr:AAA family ATPase [Pseudomonas aeruginosa]EJN6720873.1 AAA family ATPase [Pseudomonas aeruginosa]EKY4181385.1 AAA family ATPase [Pseudomonas aeruginosa]ELH7238367.1 AAA family ATPase [Pseudomonas aeruginosa]ELM1173617.1 AAA family ATPase [Pseudomonas aeruginosa]ELM7195883.1 AAA family ATPase [Pseudomonas aeruginosa]
MKIKSMRIENFRSFQDDTVSLNRYSCFVGPNGAGKSTVLAALNVFFQERHASATDISKLVDEDYFSKNTSHPIRITLTFDDLSPAAQDELAAYVRQGELVVTAEAVFDEANGLGVVRHYGQRPGMEAFRAFFEAEKAGAKASDLTPIYDGLRAQFVELPNARSKDDKAQALREYEAAHPEQCTLISSADDFYGVNSTGKLARFVQWVYVPAVKDAGEEGLEAKNTALGKLIARAVRNRTNFDAELEALKADALERYRALLERNQASLTDISQSLQRRLESWAHPNVRLGMEWLSDPVKSVVVQPPVAGIKTGDGDFLGSLARMGHGLQRSYLLALLQELADSDALDAPTLILGCEEPELYQHPPQARHLADVFGELSTGNNQILVTTHSPLFVSGDGFEYTRVVQPRTRDAGSQVKSLIFTNLCARVRAALGDDPQRPVNGLVAKIHQALQPGIAEMFFARVPVLVEGLEDVSYITTELHLSNQWSEFRRLGCHLIPVNGKDKLIQPLAIAVELGIPVFVVFDADGDTQRPDHRTKHERDNRALLTLLGQAHPPFPNECLVGANYAIWPTNLGAVVKGDFGGHYEQLVNAARARYGNEGGLEKHDLFIADWVSTGREAGYLSPTLQRLCTAILEFARTRT